MTTTSPNYEHKWKKTKQTPQERQFLFEGGSNYYLECPFHPNDLMQSVFNAISTKITMPYFFSEIGKTILKFL